MNKEADIIGQANRRAALPLEAGREFRSALCAPLSLAGRSMGLARHLLAVFVCIWREALLVSSQLNERRPMIQFAIGRRLCHNIIPPTTTLWKISDAH
jgi:hypothetical protein